MLLVGVSLLTGACEGVRYDPAQASRPYPRDLHTTRTIDVQVFREGASIEMVNATPNTYRDFDLWINQRFVRRIDELPAGGTVRLSLWGFFDERGETLNAGGLLTTDIPTPVHLVEIQEREGEELIGLVAIGE